MRQRRTPAVQAEPEPATLTLRNTAELRELRVVPRLQGLARAAGVSESQITRSLLLLGLAQAEKDPAVLARAAAICRGEG